MTAQFPDEETKSGEFKRQEDAFRERVSNDASTPYTAEAGRYHLYVSLACPWAHRTLIFRALASETGKLYGSVTTTQLSEEIKKATGLDIERRNIVSQPLRALGEFKIPVRLTSDLIPTVKVIVHREGEAAKPAEAAAPAPAPAEAPAAAPEPAEAEPAA